MADTNDTNLPRSGKKLMGNGISRRSVVKGLGAASMVPFALSAPNVLAADKTIRFLNAEPSADSVRAMRFAAAQYEKETGIKWEL